MDQKTLLALAQKTVGKTWANLVRVYPGLTLPMPTVSLNARLKTTAGRSFYTHRKIDLSTSLFAEHPFNFVGDTIPHEVCHQAAWDLFQEKGHGEPWRRVMIAIGVQPSRCHQMTNTTWEAQKANRR
jgi:SprT protein